MTILITAGPTIEDIDPVRFISNRASGTLGFAIARAAAKAGHYVILIHGPVASDVLKTAPKNATLVAVRSAAQMLDAVFAHVAQTDVVIMNAAVADFTVAKTSATKLKKSSSTFELKLKPTVDILKKLGLYKKKNGAPILIGFALETGEGKTTELRRTSALDFARAKLASKNLDAIVLNSPQTIGAKDGDFVLIERGKSEPIDLHGDKEKLAQTLVRWIASAR
ncbi:MAG: phosphopantothenoylcysteine decarboxylase [Planctomycetota bacterium]